MIRGRKPSAKRRVEFPPHWSRPNQAAAYFICGGLPFYLRCFAPSYSIEQNLATAVFDELGLLFREPEFLLREELREGVRAGFEIGEYWDKDMQIDVVGLRQDHWTDLGECKWGHVGSANALRAELRARLPRFPNLRQATLGLRFFTRQRMRITPDAATHEHWHCLDDLYELD